VSRGLHAEAHPSIVEFAVNLELQPKKAIRNAGAPIDSPRTPVLQRRRRGRLLRGSCAGSPRARAREKHLTSTGQRVDQR
jgi:hypothetical protein